MTKTIKKKKFGGAPKKSATVKMSAVEKRGFSEDNLSETAKEFLAMLDMPKNTAANKTLFATKKKNFECRGCILTGIAFSRKDLSEVKLIGAKLQNTLFNGKTTKINNVDFTDADLTGASFKESLCNESVFKNSILTNITFDKTSLNSTIFHDSNLIRANFSNISFKNIHFKNCNANLTSISDNKTNTKNRIEDCIFENNSRFINNEMYDLESINNIFKKTQIQNGRYSSTTFRDCDFRENSRIYNVSFSNTKFVNCKFEPNMIMHSNRFSDCVFENCILNSVDFRANVMSNTIFKDCKMEKCNFRNSQFFAIQKPFINTILNNSDFQTCIGLSNINFQDLQLEGAQFKGIDLTGSNFINSNLRGASFEFSNVQGADFQNARLQNAVLVGVAENWMDARNLPRTARRARAQDTHLAFNDIDFQGLKQFLLTKNIQINNDLTNEIIVNRIREYLYSFLQNFDNEDNNPDDKKLLKSRLDEFFNNRIETWNYSSTLPNVEPQITWKELTLPCVEYASKQNKEFIDLYIQILITDSAEGHGSAFSCIKGIVERLITTLGKSAQVAKDNVTEKADEYTDLIMILQPPITMQTLFQEWMTIHKDGGEDPYSEDDDINMLMDSYIEYCKEQFNFDEITNVREKEIIMDKIMNDPKAGVNNIKDQFGILYFFGGRKKYKRFTKKRKHHIKK